MIKFKRAPTVGNYITIQILPNDPEPIGFSPIHRDFGYWFRNIESGDGCEWPGVNGIESNGVKTIQKNR